MADQGGGGEFFAGLVIGGMVGAGLALLLTPQSGQQTRTQIRNVSVDLKERANETIAEAREKAEAITADARRRAEEMLNEARERAEEITAEAIRKAEEIQGSVPSKPKAG